MQSYETYKDVAISRQTRRPRIVFEENSGLASVIPVDRVNELMQAYLKRAKNRFRAARRRAKQQKNQPQKGSGS